MAARRRGLMAKQRAVYLMTAVAASHQWTTMSMSMVILVVGAAAASADAADGRPESDTSRARASSGSCCWLDSTACPLPSHSCEIPACSYELRTDDALTGLKAGTTCFTCHAERCSQATAPAGSCYTDDNLVCDPTRDPSICAATPRSTLHPGIWQMDCISFCHCQGYHGCAGDVGYELPAPPPPPRHSFSNGDTYEGELVDGKMHGRGVYRYAGGNVYTGNFVAGKPHGPDAVFEYANGDRYEGPYVNGLKDTGDGGSHAVYTFKKDGSSYTGPFKANMREGHGAVMQWPDGRRYEGSFLQGKKHGVGTMYKKDGRWDVIRYEAGKKLERLESSYGAKLGPLK